MSKTEHRRIEFSGNAIDSPDVDWAGTHTPWAIVAAPVLADGDIISTHPTAGGLAVSYEIFDGMLDTDSPVSPSPAVTLTMTVHTYAVFGAENTFELGSSQALANPQRRYVELEMGEQGLSAVHVSAAVGLPAAGSIRIYVSDRVHL